MGHTVAFFGMLLGEARRFNGSPAFSEHIPIYGVPFVSKLRFLVIFIKPATFTKHRSIDLY